MTESEGEEESEGLGNGGDGFNIFTLGSKSKYQLKN